VLARQRATLARKLGRNARQRARRAREPPKLTTRAEGHDGEIEILDVEPRAIGRDVAPQAEERLVFAGIPLVVACVA
jgi:hypothetical protein